MEESLLYDFSDANTNSSYTIDVIWKENEATLTLFSDSIYVGSITQENSSKFYKSLDINWTDYYVSLKDLKNEVFKVKFENESLVVFKGIEEGIDVIYLESKLRKLSESEIVAQVVRPLISTKRKLQEDLSRVKSSEATLKCDLESITKKFDESVRLKEQMQETLLNKFTHILNEKKRYINLIKGPNDPPPASSTRHWISSDEEDMDF